jgi:hypothetical protein
MENGVDPETGEIPESTMLAIVSVHTSAMENLRKLCSAIGFLERFDDMCKAELARVKSKQEQAARRLESIKRYLLPYVQQERERLGRPITVGTYTLSTRKSEAVEVSEVFTHDSQNRKLYCTKKITYTPDLKKIRNTIKGGEQVNGASIKPNVSLQIK